MEQIYTAIQAAANQDANEFREAIGAALATKIQDALELLQQMAVIIRVGHLQTLL